MYFLKNTSWKWNGDEQKRPLWEFKMEINIITGVKEEMKFGVVIQDDHSPEKYISRKLESDVNCSHSQI